MQILVYVTKKRQLIDVNTVINNRQNEHFLSCTGSFDINTVENSQEPQVSLVEAFRDNTN